MVGLNGRCLAVAVDLEMFSTASFSTPSFEVLVECESVNLYTHTHNHLKSSTINIYSPGNFSCEYHSIHRVNSSSVPNSA